MGYFKINNLQKAFKIIDSYIKRQGRFKHMTDEDIENVVKARDQKWNFINKYFN